MGDPAVLEAIAARYPLSTQQRLCCEEPETSGSGFILPFALRIKGKLDIDALQGALDDVVERHEVLRTRITCGGDGQAPYQTILAAQPVPFTVYELAPEPDRSRDQLADELLIQLNTERMDMSETPLLRAALHRFDDRDAVLTILSHHSAGDGWSCNLIRRDLAACYQARTTGIPHELPEVRQYREFGAWQQEWVSGQRASAAREYWHAKLAGTQVFALPADRPNGPGVLQSPYATANFVVEPAAFAAVEARAGSVRGSGWHAILAAGALLAEKVRGSSDVTLMTNVSGRTDWRFHDTVGFFADFLPLRIELGDCATLGDALVRSRSSCLEAYRNLIPISIIEAGLPEFTKPYDEPWSMPFIFNYSRPVIGPADFQFAESVESVTLATEEPTDRGGWCIWSMWKLPSGGLRGVIEYSPDLVDSSTVERWVEEFVQLLSLIADVPNQHRKGQ
ncbi:MAG: condensation domain-containing protein [Jatrophihabitantaceae bacterium]